MLALKIAFAQVMFLDEEVIFLKSVIVKTISSFTKYFSHIFLMKQIFSEKLNFQIFYFNIYLILPQPKSLLQILPYHSRGAFFGFAVTAATESFPDLTLPQARSLLRVGPYHSPGASRGLDVTAAAEPLAG
jgi:hypothetical protein